MLALPFQTLEAVQEYYSVNGGGSVKVNEWSMCKIVANSSGSPETFIPTKTSDEWTTFISNKPDHISLSECPNCPWQYRRQLTITSSSALSGYQVSFYLDTASLIAAGKMRSDCGDLRVRDTDGTTDLPYWIEINTCNTSNTRVWTKVASIPNGTKTIWTYYGNPGAVFASNGTSVFDFFDDFPGTTLNTSKWSIGIGSGGWYSINNGIELGANVSSSSSAAYLSMKNTMSMNLFNGTHSLEFYGRLRSSGIPSRPWGNLITCADSTGEAKMQLVNYDLSSGLRLMNQKYDYSGGYRA